MIPLGDSGGSQDTSSIILPGRLFASARIFCTGVGSVRVIIKCGEQQVTCLIILRLRVVKAALQILRTQFIWSKVIELYLVYKHIS